MWNLVCIAAEKVQLNYSGESASSCSLGDHKTLLLLFIFKLDSKLLYFILHFSILWIGLCLVCVSLSLNITSYQKHHSQCSSRSTVYIFIHSSWPCTVPLRCEGITFRNLYPVFADILYDNVEDCLSATRFAAVLQEYIEVNWGLSIGGDISFYWKTFYSNDSVQSMYVELFHLLILTNYYKSLSEIKNVSDINLSLHL